MQRIKALVFNPYTLLALFSVAAIYVSVVLISLGAHPYKFPVDPFPADIMNTPENMNQFEGKLLTEYNNYRIFKYSYFHLLEGDKGVTDVGLHGIYGLHPSEHWDFYKYSPTFALLMGMFAYLPDVVGLCLWNLVNVLAIFFAIRMLPFTNKTKALILWFIANEVFTCLSNTQSNGLMCGLIVAAYGCMQSKKLFWAALWISLATFIKVYGAIGFCLFLFYPGKGRFVLYSSLCCLVLAALPLLVTPLHTLLWDYKNWAYLIKEDAAAAVGLSVAGWLETWFGITNIKAGITITGIVLFLIPFARYKLYTNERYRLLTVASMLIWVIIFNHKAESSTYIIAVTGVAIWYFSSARAKWRTVLLFVVLLFTCLSTTDLFPPYLKRHFIYPYDIKTVPCIIVWCVVFVELMLKSTFRNNGKLSPAATAA